MNGVKIGIGLDSVKSTGSIPVLRGTQVVSGVNSEFGASSDWENGTGGAFGWSIATGELTLAFNNGNNECIKLSNILTIGENYVIDFKVKKTAGDGCVVTMGHFTGSDVDYVAHHEVTNTTYKERTVCFFSAYAADIHIGCVAANNNGSTVVFEYFRVYEMNDTAFDVADISSQRLGYNVNDADTWLSTLTRTTKNLIRIGVAGDSIWANQFVILPSGDEGETNRPYRLIGNNLARRLYDNLSWNKPVFERIDSANWTLSDAGHFTNNDGDDWLEPRYGVENLETAFYYSQTSGAYAEIDVPDGYENFCLVVVRDDNNFTNDHDNSLGVTINGGSIAAYGATTINGRRAKDHASSLGNPFYLEEYAGLPAGANTIRITKQANTDTFILWGLFYWTGNSLVVTNVAHGGLPMENLRYAYKAEVEENAFDAILLQYPGFNEAGNNNTIIESHRQFERYINQNSLLEDRLLVVGTHPMGDDGAGTNYYTTHNDPHTLKEYFNRAKLICSYHNVKYYDIFAYCEKSVNEAGGTLEGGEWTIPDQTSDGQHLSATGFTEVEGYLNLIFDNMLLT